MNNCHGFGQRRPVDVVRVSGTIRRHLLHKCRRFGKGPTVESGLEGRTLELVAKLGVIRPRDLATQGIPRKYLNLLYHKGLIRKSGRGLYVAADAKPTEHRSLVEVCKRVPHGVVCLLSALQFHGLTTQLPYEVWLAIDRKARIPKEPGLPIRTIRFSGKARTEGVQIHQIEGVQVRIYSPAKTIADCFKFRNKVGLEVAIEALMDGLSKRVCKVDELLRYAQVCRVSKIMKPYMEALV